MEELFNHTADPPIDDTTSYMAAVAAIKKGLGKRVNNLFPMYTFFNNMPQGKKPIHE